MDLWVIDTCSIIQIRRGPVPGPQIPVVYNALSQLVAAGTLLYPKQVVGELEECTGSSSNKPDLPYLWAKRNEAQATRFGFDPANLKLVLAHPVASQVLDTSKSGKDEADPYVLELATRLQAAGHDVTVLTEDRNNKPMKLSLHSACGVLKIVPLGIEVFLESQGIFKKSKS